MVGRGILLAVLGCVLVGVALGRSDVFGRNPQHDFGSVTGRRQNPVLPFWTMTGDAFANEDFIRLTPDRQSKRGGVWNTQKLGWGEFQVLVKFDINGVSQSGADGFGWWLVEEGQTEGSFFGFTEQFVGIGVVVDTYDNDHSGQHPMIVVLQNDGELTYEHSHDKDGHHGGEMEIGHCSIPNVRNKEVPTVMRITVKDGTLTVETRDEDEGEKKAWKSCVEIEDVSLPPVDLYMGLTAATGDLADNHDIHGISMRNMAAEGRYFDSEARFAQFSKYMIAESLGRIQADLRRALAPRTQEVKKQLEREVPKDWPAPHMEDSTAEQIELLLEEVHSMRADFLDLMREQNDKNSEKQGGKVAARRMDGADSKALATATEGVQKATGEVKELAAPLRAAASSLQAAQREVAQLTEKFSQELNKMVKENSKFQRSFESISQADRSLSGLSSMVRTVADRFEMEDSNDGGILSYFFNAAFLLVVIVAGYLGFLLYRVKVEQNRNKFV
mmetsp:Transcript_8625/g.24336  ORF Transcript_8625/g.24336 Transcript_8625/m.24336 type:complete len:501 (+) Transcript_8625:94-1596(+)